MRSLRTRHDWKALLLEIAIIVVGILIAFALDSWWDNRAQALRERAHLRALRGDFAENVERLDDAIAAEEEVVRGSRRLLVLTRSGRSLVVDTVRNQMSRVFSSGRFEPVMGAYEAIVNSGGLTQISDDSLRAALAEFSSDLGTRYAEEYGNELYFSFIREFAGRMGFPWYDPVAEDSDSESLQPPDWDHMELLRDRRFQEHLALRTFAERDVARYYRTLEERAKRILALLKQQLER